ncbi:hypothetical protein FHR92_003856 [Fontibacillus solani]|uniref:Uncharacterized protein n=1 Tax=Fontibacillus solani TaxID=1572857 RepID=A0A7W3SWA8_9BACL|nr:hypothetical protein [Fontibacillus solani]MBA9087372.1 hypothetical protein [Fontibacillus solani]
MAFIFLNRREKDVLNAVRALDAADRDFLSAVLKVNDEESEKDSIAELRRSLIFSHRKY